MLKFRRLLQAQQQPAQANGTKNSVGHMHQWLAARITEPARRMLDFHMDSYALVIIPYVYHLYSSALEVSSSPHGKSWC